MFMLFGTLNTEISLKFPKIWNKFTTFMQNIVRYIKDIFLTWNLPAELSGMDGLNLYFTIFYILVPRPSKLFAIWLLEAWSFYMLLMCSKVLAELNNRCFIQCHLNHPFPKKDLKFHTNFSISHARFPRVPFTFREWLSTAKDKQGLPLISVYNMVK